MMGILLTEMAVIVRVRLKFDMCVLESLVVVVSVVTPSWNELKPVMMEIRLTEMAVIVRVR